MKAVVIILFSGVSILLNVSAKAESLVTLLSSYQISITPGYDGGEISLVAVADYPLVNYAEPFDVVIVTRGPKRDMAINKKFQYGVFWLNRTIKRYTDVSSFVSVQSSRPLAAIASQERLKQLALDQASLLSLNTESLSATEAALIDLQSERGLWKTSVQVVPITGRIFQSSIAVPSSAPAGNYAVDVYLLTGGILLQKNALNFSIVKEGMSYDIFWMSLAHPLIYGIMLCMFSVFAGWLASMLFRRA